jgi:hypothetical protein
MPSDRCACSDTQIAHYNDRLKKLLLGFAFDHVFFVDMTLEAKQKLAAYKKAG